jgi:hypothetical protein
MAYTLEITKVLTDQLAKFITLNRHQLSGQVANLDFWTGEVRHCLDIIDGYTKRFERLKAGQVSHVSEHRTIEFDLSDPCCINRSAPPPRRVSHAELQEARRVLSDATYHFLVRCLRERLIEVDSLRGICDRLGLGIEARDLR